MSFGLQALCNSLLAPVLATAVIYYLCRRVILGRISGDSRETVSGLLALLLGFSISFFLFPWMPVWPSDPWEYLGYVAMVIALTTPILLIRPDSFWIRQFVCCVLAIVTAVTIVPDWPGLSGGQTNHWLVLGIILFASMVIWDLLSSDSTALSNGTSYVISTLMVSAILVLSGNAKLGQIAGLLVVGLLTVAAICYWSGTWSSVMGLSSPLVLLLGALLYLGYITSYSSIPVYVYALPLFTPLVGLLFSFEPKVANEKANQWTWKQASYLAPVLLLALLTRNEIADSITELRSSLNPTVQESQNKTDGENTPTLPAMVVNEQSDEPDGGAAFLPGGEDDLPMIPGGSNENAATIPDDNNNLPLIPD